MSSTTKEVDVVADPFGNRTPEELEAVGYAPVEEDMGAVAAGGLEDEGASQPALDVAAPPEGAKVTFRGVQYNDVKEELELGEAYTFLVTGTVSDEGTTIMHDGHRRRYFKVDVDSVKPA